MNEQKSVDSAFRGTPRRTAPVVSFEPSELTLGSDTPVTHLLGYESLLSLLGPDDAAIATNPSLFLEWVQEKRLQIEKGGLQKAAAIFFGNTLLQDSSRPSWVTVNGELIAAGYPVVDVITRVLKNGDVTIEEFVKGWRAPKG